MNTTVQQFLDAFDALPEADRLQTALEIFRRVSPVMEGDMPKSALIEAAEERFHILDAEEVEHAQQGLAFDCAHFAEAFRWGK